MTVPSHTPRVSLLMAVYNAQQFLDQAIQSVLCQSFEDWQLICVDDASTDDSLKILQHYSDEDGRIQVVSKAKNEGQAVARNDALKLARGEYVTMLDADDWLSRDCLEQAINTFTDQTDTVILRLVQHVDGGKMDDELFPMPYAENSVLSGYDAFVASLDWTIHGLYVVRRSIHEQYPYDTSCRLYSDDNTTRLHYLHSREVRFCEGAYFYRKHAASCTNAITMDRFLYMDANISMRDTLIREQVDPKIIQFYEKHRWHNYIGQIWLFAQYRSSFSKSDRNLIYSHFRRVYSTFTSRPVPPKFGYTYFKSYCLFQIQEVIYFSLRLLFRH